MMDTRLSLALEAGHVSLPEAGEIVVLGASGQSLAGLSKERLLLVVDDVIAASAYEAQGYVVKNTLPEAAADALVFVPRGRLEGRVLFAQAAKLTDGAFIVDGVKTDGVDSHFKELRKRGTCSAAYSKAHGKIFRCELPAGATDDWLEAGKGGENAEGFFTVPGVFSADKADEGSRLLAAVLPEKLGKEVADLGAGWGYLARSVLEREAVETLHLVEASHAALSCAKHNITDARAQFHWADATRWQPRASLDSVVMNPPFHTGRKGVPELGQAFIASAAAALKGVGHLYMVANRHLPYEEALRARFGFVEELDGGNSRFKIIHAAKPSRKR
ncbi:class I SAM-dependent methyltransferase [Lentibacter sp. XHP0401]|uniref:class I SAM-dependent methyltransferase n=1 Tax=Lentibacter sp. XHP0401 TaxID=2984334 RepID=UPI00298121A9|nr:methyltransferase [Lentibacter sp. XHP0401]